MNNSKKNHPAMRTSKLIASSLITAILLSACGGGGTSSSSNSSNNNVIVNNSGNQTDSSNLDLNAKNSDNIVVTGTITTMGISNTSNIAQSNVPVTFGQVFKVGALKTNEYVAAKLSDGTVIPLQIDIKATHNDGSVRHAVLSAIIPKMASNETLSLGIVKTSTPVVSTAKAVTVSDLIKAGFASNVQINVGGTVYRVSADDLLKISASKKWLSGPVVSEFMVAAPFRTLEGVVQPNLSARFNIRAYQGLKNVRVDMDIENTWAYTPPKNVTYDVTVNMNDKPVYTKNSLTHYTYARWRKTFWWGNEPQVYVSHDPRYLIDTMAVPNYDPNLKNLGSAIYWANSTFAGGVTEPMANGLATPYMPTTGGRPDIGILPGWAVTYLLTQDKGVKNATLGTADLAGSWSAHYRDQNTGRPIDLFDYPYMTILGHYGDTYNPVTKKYEAFPDCAGDCSSNNSVDGAHTPNFAYLPYIVTGDYYYLEELEFWAMYHAFATNPGYRQNIKGIVNSEQVRGQAWNLRTIGEAAYIAPDNDPLKPHLNAIVDSNLDWYNSTYVNVNQPGYFLGAILNGYSLVYDNGNGLAPWQDDFFTSAIGHLNELGFTKAKTLLQWKAQFPVSRMTDPGYCWIFGSIYELDVKNDTNGLFYNNWSEIYQRNVPASVRATQCGTQSMADAMQSTVENGIRAGQMVSLAPYSAGYPANMQPAVAYSADSGVANGAKAWDIFSHRNVQPDYSDGAQFDIVPRSK